MGTAPSKESPGRAVHKLSKPRLSSTVPTSTSTAQNGASVTPNSPYSTSPYRHDLAAPDLISIPYSATTSLTSAVQGDVRSVGASDGDDGDKAVHQDHVRPAFLAAPKVQRRLSLFRSKSSQDTSDRRKSRRNTVIGPPSLALPSPPESTVVGRANSVSTHPLAGEAAAGPDAPHS